MARSLEDPALSARAYLEMAWLARSVASNIAPVQSWRTALERATELAEASGSAELIATAARGPGQAHYASGEFAEAIELMERAIPTLIESGQPYIASVGAGQLGTAYGHLGDFEKAVEWTDRGVRAGRAQRRSQRQPRRRPGARDRRGHPGRRPPAIEYATKAVSVADRVGNKACAMVAHGVIGEQHLRDGDAAQAAIAFEASADLAAFCQFMPVKIEQTELLLQTARARSGVGRVEFERYERALELARQFGDRLAEAGLYEQRASDRIAAGQTEAAVEDLSRAAAVLDELGATAHLHRVHELQASL